MVRPPILATVTKLLDMVIGDDPMDESERRRDRWIVALSAVIPIAVLVFIAVHVLTRPPEKVGWARVSLLNPSIVAIKMQRCITALDLEDPSDDDSEPESEDDSNFRIEMECGSMLAPAPAPPPAPPPARKPAKPPTVRPPQSQPPWHYCDDVGDCSPQYAARSLQ